jgi:hypothetical protein
MFSNAAAAMAHPKEHRNGMDVVCRPERKWLFTLNPLPQLHPHPHLHQLLLGH